MSKIAIVTDSTASVPSELKKQYGIATVPLLHHLDNKTYGRSNSRCEGIIDYPLFRRLE